MYYTFLYIGNRLDTHYSKSLELKCSAVSYWTLSFIFPLFMLSFPPLLVIDEANNLSVHAWKAKYIVGLVGENKLILNERTKFIIGGRTNIISIFLFNYTNHHLQTVLRILV